MSFMSCCIIGSKDLEAVMNSELQKVINYCNLNKLSLNMRKTNFMIITSPQKPAIHNINILNIERKLVFNI